MMIHVRGSGSGINIGENRVYARRRRDRLCLTDAGLANAAKPSDCYLYQLSSAMNLNIFEPFTPEQAALSLYLSDRLAGKRLCDYAWRLYAQSVT